VLEHPVDGDQGPLAGFGMHADAVDDLAPGEVVEHPAEVFLINAVHRRTQALTVAQDADVDALGLELVGKTVDQVDLGAHGPARAGLGFAEGLDDVLRAAGEVGLVDDFFAALGVDENLGAQRRLEASVGGADLVAVFRAEEFVYGTVPGPKDDVGGEELLRG
jgi:hypothetical protein